jgi:hypothetical protein
MHTTPSLFPDLDSEEYSPSKEYLLSENRKLQKINSLFEKELANLQNMNKELQTKVSELEFLSNQKSLF